MIFDLQSMFSDQQAITASVDSTNVIDLGPVDTPKHAVGPVTRDVGRGAPINLRVQATEDFTNLTNLTAVVTMSDVEDFSSGSVTLARGVASLGQLKAGFVFPMSYLGHGTVKRYLKIAYTVAGTAPDAGKITAGIVFGQDGWSA